MTLKAVRLLERPLLAVFVLRLWAVKFEIGLVAGCEVLAAQTLCSYVAWAVKSEIGW